MTITLPIIASKCIKHIGIEPIHAKMNLKTSFRKDKPNLNPEDVFDFGDFKGMG